MSFLINPYRFAGPTTDPYFSNVSLLLHGDGTNGSTTITDSSPSPKTVTAVGNAQISTAQSKFGGASIALDGTGDWLDLAGSSAFSFAADFTIETFLYWNGTRGEADTILELGVYTNGILLRAGSGSTGTGYQLYVNGVFNQWTTSPAETINEWVHLAVARSGSTITFYFNGVARMNLSFTGTVNSVNAATRIGMERTENNLSRAINAYIDDFRITKGVARYTANFTPPTAPFPDA